MNSLTPTYNNNIQPLALVPHVPVLSISHQKTMSSLSPHHDIIAVQVYTQVTEWRPLKSPQSHHTKWRHTPSSRLAKYWSRLLNAGTEVLTSVSLSFTEFVVCSQHYLSPWRHYQNNRQNNNGGDRRTLVSSSFNIFISCLGVSK